MNQYKYTKFIDETGDLNFFGKGGNYSVGTDGISKSFGIGMVQMKQCLQLTREQINDLVRETEEDRYLNTIPSVKKKIENGGFYFHAKDDAPEVREKFFKYLDSVKFSLEIIIARKNLGIFIRKHNRNENEFYADILGHLLKNKMAKYGRLVLNIAQRGSATSSVNLELAKSKALSRFQKKNPAKNGICKVVYNVQDFKNEPILSVADYAAWAVQRIFERGDTRYYNFIKDKIPLIIDLYDTSKYEKWGNYYSDRNPLTSENIIEIDPPTS